MRSINIPSATVEAAAQAHCAHSFTDLPHHFDSGDYKLRPLMVYRSENSRAFPFYAFSIHAAIRRNATPAYNESRLYLFATAPLQLQLFCGTLILLHVLIVYYCCCNCFVRSKIGLPGPFPKPNIDRTISDPDSYPSVMFIRQYLHVVVRSRCALHCDLQAFLSVSGTMLVTGCFIMYTIS
jgi:hypothetical protein